MTTISMLAAACGAESVHDEFDDAVLCGAFTSDLLSDVVANAPADSVLITIQGHINTVAVATLAGIRAILVCSGRPVAADMIAAARRERIAVLRSADNQFVNSCRVGRLLLP